MYFFQEEDGIRDYKVTGVQTCALPISGGPTVTTDPADGRLIYADEAASTPPAPARPLTRVYRRADKSYLTIRTEPEIGRASCREGVEAQGGAEAVTR